MLPLSLFLPLQASPENPRQQCSPFSSAPNKIDPVAAMTDKALLRRKNHHPNSNPMGKKRPIVAISSDEDEKVTGDRSSSRSRSRSAPPSKISRRGGSCKKPNAGRSKAHSCSRSEEVAKFDKLSEDFGECLRDFHAVPGLKSTNMKEIWVDKYKPHSFAELAVHKKKVDEVKGWLEGRLMTSEKNHLQTSLVADHLIGLYRGMTKFYKWQCICHMPKSVKRRVG